MSRTESGQSFSQRSSHGKIIYWPAWISEAGVSEQDFQNNEKILRDSGLIRKAAVSEYVITPEGMEKVRDYRRREKRLEDFERLERLEA